MIDRERILRHKATTARMERRDAEIAKMEKRIAFKHEPEIAGIKAGIKFLEEGTDKFSNNPILRKANAWLLKREQRKLDKEEAAIVKLKIEIAELQSSNDAITRQRVSAMAGALDALRRYKEGPEEGEEWKS